MEQTLIEWLRPRRLLIILDNCEHLVDACAAFTESVLRHAPSLRILATSREALNVPGEVVWRVPPLALPPDSETRGVHAMLAFDAIRLFAERAAAVTSFQLADDNVGIVVDICSRLDGLPLALELAAARVRHSRSPRFAARLDDRFQLLSGGDPHRRGAPAARCGAPSTGATSCCRSASAECSSGCRCSRAAWTLEAGRGARAAAARHPTRVDVLDLLAAWWTSRWSSSPRPGFVTSRAFVFWERCANLVASDS